jgi:hypothetical protein
VEGVRILIIRRVHELWVFGSEAAQRAMNKGSAGIVINRIVGLEEIMKCVLAVNISD